MQGALLFVSLRVLCHPKKEEKRAHSLARIAKHASAFSTASHHTASEKEGEEERTRRDTCKERRETTHQMQGGKEKRAERLKDAACQLSSFFMLRLSGNKGPRTRGDKKERKIHAMV